MNTLHFTVKINAPREKVWKILWDDATYLKWTSAFSEGSHAKSDWKEGSKVYFLDGKGRGMYSTIAKMTPNEHMSFSHQGDIKDGKEEPANSEWAGSKENYTLTEMSGGGTELKVDVDALAEFEKYFLETFPKALANVKELSEK
ncbi:MAG TPA: SRPBCC domain-containing protein [Flavobacteriales bacterium]|nr:SRPBCC domain-containing protein [Flavobacteriales bacterium]